MSRCIDADLGKATLKGGYMSRLLYIYDPDTGKRLEQCDVTGLPHAKVTQIEFEMRCKWDLDGIFVDTDKDGDACSTSPPNGPDSHQP